MAVPTPKFALDTNFLLDLAAEDNDCKECLEVLMERPVVPKLIATPTVLAELQNFADKSREPQTSLAIKALQSLQKWGVIPVNFSDSALVQIAAQKILDERLLPAQEHNDARIIAEASHCNVHFLLTSDTAITGINKYALHAVLRDCHFAELSILWPQKAVKMLGR